MENPIQEHSQSTLLELKAFNTIRKNFAMVGYSPTLVTQSYPFNWKIFIGFLLLISNITFVCVFIFNDAETFFEYTQSIYIASVVGLFIFIFVILILKVEKFFEWINRSDRMVNTGKWRFNFF